MVEAAEQDLDAIRSRFVTALMNCWWNLLQCVDVKAKKLQAIIQQRLDGITVEAEKVRSQNAGGFTMAA